jgi:hypothetical protein
MSRRTEGAYVSWIRRYVVFDHKKHPSKMGAPDIATFLSWLATERKVRASTQNQALCAILFLFKDVLNLELGPIERVSLALVSTCVSPTAIVDDNRFETRDIVEDRSSR